MLSNVFQSGHTLDVLDNQRFSQVAKAVFKEIQEAMRALIKALPVSVSRPVDFQSALDIYATLAWRVYKIAEAQDPLDAAEYITVLTTGQIRTLIDSARTKNISSNILTKIEAADEHLNSFVAEYVGNRELLPMMVASVRSSKGNLIDEKCRKIAFQQNRLIFGRQVDVSLYCCISLPPSSLSERGKTVVIQGVVGFHEIRPDSSPDIRLQTCFSKEQADDDEHEMSIVSSTEFLYDFCTPGLDIQSMGEEGGVARWVVRPASVGRLSAVDYFVMSVADEGHDRELFLFGVDITHPCMMTHMDVLLPESNQEQRFTGKVYEKLSGRSRRGARLPVDCSSTYLGAMTDVPTALDIPQYPEMIQFVLKKFGCYGSRFDVYRNRLSYPVLPSTVEVQIAPVSSTMFA